MAETFKATKLKLSDYDVMLTLGTGIENYKLINSQVVLGELDWQKIKKLENMLL